MFLWVVLVIEELLDGWEGADPITSLREKPASLPVRVEELFGRMLQKVPPDQVAEAIAMFKCVLGAVEPLHLAEFRCAQAFGSDASYKSTTEMDRSERVTHTDDGLERRIQKCCGGLLEVSKPFLTVQVIHQTVLDYLRHSHHHKHFQWNEMDLTPPKCHQYLLRACLQYLSARELKNIPVRRKFSKPPHTGRSNDDMFQEFHFLFYSLRNWVDHYIFAEQDGSSQSRQTRNFAKSENDHFLTWYKLYCHCFGDGWDGHSPPFFSFAAEHSLYGYVKDRLERSEIESIDEGEFGGPVQAAVMSNDLTMVRLILDHGIDVNTVGGRFGTAIAAAITFKNHDMVSLLKEYGARVVLHSPSSPLPSTLRHCWNEEEIYEIDSESDRNEVCE